MQTKAKKSPSVTILLLTLIGFISLPNLAWTQETTEESLGPAGQVSLEELRAFVRVFEQLRQGYVEELTDAELFEMAVWGMLSELDPHSEFLNLEARTELDDLAAGQFQGIGVQLTMEGDYLTVVSPIDDSPADRAGVKSGDIILRINGENIENFSFRQSLELLEGEIGESVQLTLDRLSEREVIEIELTREAIKVESVSSRVVAENVGYLRISQFQQYTAEDFALQMQELIQENPLLAGLVIDLRDNPGGLLGSAVDIVDLFLDEGVVVSTKGRLESANQTYYATSGTQAPPLPLVILINRGSASASEIVAGALQDHNRAVILGDTSFGKGSVQDILSVDGQRAIKLTIALYYTPSGRSIQAQGIYPDIRVDQGVVQWNSENQGLNEAALSGHINNADDTLEFIGFSEQLSDIEDVQLAHAVSLIQGSRLLKNQVN